METKNMERRYYQNFYKLEMAMLDNNHNVVIFGPESSGKCEAIERCLELFSITKSIALFTSKGVLMSAARRSENITCFDWNLSQKTIKCNDMSNQYDMIIIDGYCKNWEEIIESNPTSRVIMAMRIESFKNLDCAIKKHFKIAAKTGIVDEVNRIKGILQIKKYA